MNLPKPYYETELGKLYHADCLDILPHLGPVDLVLTDPPYGVNKKYMESYIDSEDMVTRFVEKIFVLNSKKLITCGIANIWKYPIADWVLCWWKPNAMTRSAVANANVWEPVLVYGCKGFGVDGIKVTITPQKIDHPCPKPLGLFNWLVMKSTTSNESILDPFLGSGTTAVACERLKRRWIGIEIEEKYCEIAAKRIENERKQLKLF